MSAPGVEPGSGDRSRIVPYAATSTTTPNTSSIPPTHCRNGLHLKTPDNLLRNSRGHLQCKACRYAADKKYVQSPRGRAATQRKHARYKATINGYLTRRMRDLERQRAIVVEKLSRLTAEEV